MKSKRLLNLLIIIIATIMKRTFLILITIVLFTNTYIFGDTYKVTYKGTLSNPILNGYARSISFYNDTCYILTGSGNVLLANVSGVLLDNQYAGIGLSNSTDIYADNRYLVIADNGNLRFYNKKGEYLASKTYQGANIPLHLWGKSPSRIFVASQNGISAFDCNTLNRITTFSEIGIDDSNQYTSFDGNLYDIGYHNFWKFSWSGSAPTSVSLNSDKFQYWNNNGYYLASMFGQGSLWYKYKERDTLYIMNSSFDIIASIPLLPTSNKPTDEDLDTESGDPNLKIYAIQDKVYITNATNNKIDFYLLVNQSVLGDMQ
jgi:hypothetical protein